MAKKPNKRYREAVLEKYRDDIPEKFKQYKKWDRALGNWEHYDRVDKLWVLLIFLERISEMRKYIFNYYSVIPTDLIVTNLFDNYYDDQRMDTEEEYFEELVREEVEKVTASIESHTLEIKF